MVAHVATVAFLGLLGAMGVIDAETLANYVVIGELALDGRIAASSGVLLAAIHASTEGLGLICPAAQGSEAAWASAVEIIAAPDLLTLLNHLRGGGILPAPVPGEAVSQRSAALCSRCTKARMDVIANAA